MNVLIYSGNGTSQNSVKQAYSTLKGILGHAYDVMKVDAINLQQDPWEDTCSLLVIPGGRDVPYCEDLNGKANIRIKNYVNGGGRYIGFCAGAYYASKSVEFEKGSPIEVTGSRELGFFPGQSKGTMFPGFVYNSEKGAKAVSIRTMAAASLVNDSRRPTEFKSYYNGGGYFVNAQNYDNVTILCTYQDKGGLNEKEEGHQPDVSAAAGVQCQIGAGSAVLFGFHPEYDVSLLDLSENDHGELVKKEILESATACRAFLTDALRNIGLKVQEIPREMNSAETAVETSTPALTPLYLTALSYPVLQAVKDRLLKETNAQSVLRDNNDTFHISQLNDDLQNGNEVERMLEDLSLESSSEEKTSILRILYPSTIVAEGNISNAAATPKISMTPMFDLQKYYKALKICRQQEWGGGAWYHIGNVVLYSAVTTSTQTILDKNYTFAQALPSGTVCIATTQISGRGRGCNSWVSQVGAVQCSFIIRHSAQLSMKAPVVFIQYIMALAVVDSIRERKGYENVPLRVKWPNDVYAETKHEGLKKVAGLLVNSSFAGEEFLLVAGFGLNLDNPLPTVSINDVIQETDPKLERLEKEDVAANVLVVFEKYYMEFCEKGIGPWFLDKYYSRWLHSDKLVTLTTHNNEKVRITGITSDYGMLEAVSINNPRQRFTLQPDGNSFDMLKGLIIKKT
ncbi:biotin-protein ligase [Mycotypha africana]|uniref:biotin-protein ligase n=1 Tax=Mycotypha africana TaxID=64632 RepID=UPI0023015DAE|nr:biotin-protein ligase [Mycotypha africana]KAI8984219.1 biotin-protein ligase [Mycotypha africana]